MHHMLVVLVSWFGSQPPSHHCLHARCSPCAAQTTGPCVCTALSFRCSCLRLVVKRGWLPPATELLPDMQKEWRKLHHSRTGSYPAVCLLDKSPTGAAPTLSSAPSLTVMVHSSTFTMSCIPSFALPLQQQSMHWWLHCNVGGVMAQIVWHLRIVRQQCCLTMYL